jgi:Fuc2NAc and GlcNAc transferase
MPFPLDWIVWLNVVLSVLLSVMATGLVLSYARHRLIDQITERSSHAVPTPRGGGLGVTIGMAAAWCLSLVYVGANGPWWLVLGALTALAALGWWDDHADLSPRIRFPAQLTLAAACVWAVGIPVSGSLAGWTVTAPMWLALVLAALGATWMLNLTNFMDGIDGIAGSQGVVMGVTAALVLGPTTPAGALGLALAGACVGFLWWNWPPAKIFMGDVGSTVLGLVFAVLVLAEVREGLALDLALLPVAPFVLDATGTLIRRAWRRERLSQAHRSHLYQRLSRHWGGHLPVTLLYAGLAMLGSVGVFATLKYGVQPGIASASFLMVFLGLVGYGRWRCPP